jgi:branched-chain amino acid transport system permease protein
VLLTVWSGLVLGAVYATVALGFSVGVLSGGVFNFAQGAVVVGGTYLGYTFLGVDHLGLIVAIGLNILIGITLGVLCDVICVRPLRGGTRVFAQYNELVSTIGLSTLLVGAIGLNWGYLPKAVPFDGPTAPVRFLGIVAQPDQIVLVTGAIIAAFGLHLWFHRTRLGQEWLAVAEDREAAALRGVNVDLVGLAGFAVAGAFGTVSALAIGPITYAVPTLAVTLAVGGFVAMAIGGSSNFVGCLAGGLLVGVASSMATRYLGANYADLAVFALLLVTLAVRPLGFGAAVAARRV